MILGKGKQTGFMLRALTKRSRSKEKVDKFTGLQTQKFEFKSSKAARIWVSSRKFLQILGCTKLRRKLPKLGKVFGSLIAPRNQNRSNRILKNEGPKLRDGTCVLSQDPV